ncbi:MAG: hypothetical protein RQ731_07790 [Anaerosomatales bacterium]|nr:hypothetical protein [Anaerosomatales bacterium]MDT8434638.1 hypothetical protein [Anaerosomatales bacterium]
MRRHPYWVPMITVLIVSAALAGCALPRADEPVVAEPEDVTAQPSEPAVPAVPPEIDTEIVSVELGEEATAGPWTLLVREAEFEDSFGDLSASNGGTLLKLEMRLANSSADDLMATPTDFTLSDGTASALPMTGVPELTPERAVPAGGSVELTAVFSISAAQAEAPLDLVFQPAEGGAVSIAVDIR